MTSSPLKSQVVRKFIDEVGPITESQMKFFGLVNKADKMTVIIKPVRYGKNWFHEMWKKFNKERSTL